MIDECAFPAAKPTSAYVMGCRCDRCTTANAEDHRVRYAATVADPARRLELRRRQRVAYHARRRRDA